MGMKMMLCGVGGCVFDDRKRGCRTIANDLGSGSVYFKGTKQIYTRIYISFMSEVESGFAGTPTNVT